MGQKGEVLEVIEETNKIQILTVRICNTCQDIKVVHYKFHGRVCKQGSIVQVNTSAIDLGLGTGGYGFVISIYDEIEERIEKTDYPGHIMKLRYTPHQCPVLAVESPESKYHFHFQETFSLQGKKIFIGELHSMLPVLASLLYQRNPNTTLAYIMDDQASLCIAFSEHVRYLNERMNLTTITYGQSIGGDIEVVNIYTALEAAVKVTKADHIIITQGPGVVGTGTQRGFSGMQLAQWIHAIHTCGGEAIVIPRIQFSDKRERHNGLSHHTFEPLAHHTLTSAYLPYPVSKEKNNDAYIAGSRDQWLYTQFKALEKNHNVIPITLSLFQKELEQALLWYGRPIKTMGRGYEQEPYFFYAIGAAYYLYKSIRYDTINRYEE
jgi:hypothetical protein